MSRYNYENPWSRVRYFLSDLFDNIIVVFMILWIVGVVGFLAVSITYGLGYLVVTQSWPPEGGLARIGVIIAAMLLPAAAIVAVCHGIGRGYRAMERRWDEKRRVADNDNP